jgi:hypothetical protein
LTGHAGLLSRARRQSRSWQRARLLLSLPVRLLLLTGPLRGPGLRLRQLRQLGRAGENFRRSRCRAASQQRKRKGQLARHRGFLFTGRAEGGALISSVIRLNAG